MAGTIAWKCAWIEPKTPLIDYAYAHIACGDKGSVAKSEQSPLTEEQVRRIWDGIEDIMEERIFNGQIRVHA